MTTQENGFWTTFMPHGHCYLWQADILWLNVISDAFIALAYFSIPIALFWVIRKKPNIPYQSMIVMFSLFILSCGITHVVGIWTVWNGDYGLQGLAKGVTAVISVATAIMLVPLLPKIVSLKSPEELQTMIQQLQETLDTQKASQKKLGRAEERFKAFLQQSPDGILIMLGSGKIEYSNDMTNIMFGRSLNDLDGQYITELLPERSRHKISKDHNDLFNEKKARSKFSGAEITGMRKDGSEFPIEIRLSPITSTQESNNEDEILLATLRDITDRKKLEEITRKEFAELAHVSRLSTVGEMAAGLAHEINQPLTAISNNLHTAMSMENKKANPDLELLEIMQENYDSAQRAGQIIRGLRQLVSKSDGTKEVKNINDLVASTVKLIAAEAKAASVIISQELDENIPSNTQLDTVQIQQVLVNLGRNAIEAFAEQKSDADRAITIATSTTDSKTILVYIRDNGPGLNADVAANLFQPYITSKSSGMGLGLSICRTIVESYGGRLWHEDMDNHGTTFCFTIPILTGDE